MLPSIPTHSPPQKMLHEITKDYWFSLNFSAFLSRQQRDIIVHCPQNSPSTINRDRVRFPKLWEKYTCTDFYPRGVFGSYIIGIMNKPLQTGHFATDLMIPKGHWWQASIIGNMQICPPILVLFIIKILSTPNSSKWKIIENLIEASRKWEPNFQFAEFSYMQSSSDYVGVPNL